MSHDTAEIALDSNVDDSGGAERRGRSEFAIVDDAMSSSAGVQPLGGTATALRALPTSAEQRHHGLDAVRGFALLGLIVAHLTIFAHPSNLSLTWTTLPYEGLGRLYFVVASIFVYGKANVLFGALFGASVIFVAGKDPGAEGEAGRLWYRRMRWLAVFGLLHGFLLFHADILLLYAICGLIVLWRVRRRSARWLAVAGAISYVAGTALLLGVALSAATAGEAPEFLGVERQLAAFGGSFWSAAWLRMIIVITNVASLPLFLWVVAGIMMLGMSLMKARILTGERSERFYLRLCLAGLAVGLPLTAMLYGWAESIQPDPVRVTVWMGAHQIVGIPTALGYLGGILYAFKRGLLRRAIHALSCVGRMALTNYLLQSAIAGFIFYGYGLGHYGTLDMAGLLPILFGVLIVNVVVSVLWLRWFRFGPAEWIWRWATYRARPPLLLRYEQTVAARSGARPRPEDA